MLRNLAQQIKLIDDKLKVLADKKKRLSRENLKLNSEITKLESMYASAELHGRVHQKAALINIALHMQNKIDQIDRQLRDLNNTEIEAQSLRKKLLEQFDNAYWKVPLKFVRIVINPPAGEEKPNHHFVVTTTDDGIIEREKMDNQELARILEIDQSSFLLSYVPAEKYARFLTPRLQGESFSLKCLETNISQKVEAQEILRLFNKNYEVVPDEKPSPMLK